jgi:hypothetical protein
MEQLTLVSAVARSVVAVSNSQPILFNSPPTGATSGHWSMPTVATPSAAIFEGERPAAGAGERPRLSPAPNNRGAGVS